MDVVQHYSQTRFLSFVPKIKKDPGEWWIVEIILTGNTPHNSSYIALKIKEHFDAKDGVIFICNSRNVLILANMGRHASGESITREVHKRLPEHSCNAHITDITPEGLAKVQLRLQALEQDNMQPGAHRLLASRQERPERIVMVVDDDMIMRSLVSKAFRTRSRVIEYKSAEGVLEAYLEYLPDIVYLDIHLPDGSGIDLMRQIHEYDESCYVVILSADSIKNNILSTRDHGAKGFIVKPFTLEKLESYYYKCPTVGRRA
jgi:CheY-like chemotaxis protein